MNSAEAKVLQLAQTAETAVRIELEQRIQREAASAGFTSDDFAAGRAFGYIYTTNHDDCGGSGIRREHKDREIVFSICPCLKIRIVSEVK